MNGREILDFLEPGFIPRWEAYDSQLCNLLSEEKVWVDVGCGQNEWVNTYKHLVKKAIGTDIDYPKNKKNFILRKASKLPFEDNSVDLISLRFVIEHLQEVENDLNEFSRILKPNGKVLILTTNLLCPYIWIAKYIPEKFKTPFLSRTFNVEEEKVFPTTHPLNKPSDYKNLKNDIVLDEIKFISDLNTNNLPFFSLFMIWHLLTKPKALHKFRTNILATLSKSD